MRLNVPPPILEHTKIQHGGRRSVGADSAVVDFSSSVNPLGPPASISHILQNLSLVADYPDPESSLLVQDIAAHIGVPRESIVVGNGAIELIYNYCLAFVRSGTPVLIPVPTFQEYEAACRLHGSIPSHFKTVSLSGDMDKFKLQIPENGCIFMCNPNNPTGELVPREQILSLVRYARGISSMVFLDECFMELAVSDESAAGHVGRNDNLVVLRSMTKSFGMPGLRLGYAVAPARMASILRKVQIPWSVNLLAQEAARAAMADKRHLESSKRVIQKEYRYLRSKISKLGGFKCYDSSANFILIRVPCDSGTLRQNLYAKKILVRDCGSFAGLDSRHIRVAVRKHRDNVRLVRALEETACGL